MCLKKESTVKSTVKNLQKFDQRIVNIEQIQRSFDWKRPDLPQISQNPAVCTRIYLAFCLKFVQRSHRSAINQLHNTDGKS